MSPDARLYVCFSDDTTIKDTTMERQRPNRRFSASPPFFGAHFNRHAFRDRTP